MAKTSKFVPQKETPFSSRPFENALHVAIEELIQEPHLKSFIPTGCPTGADFKVEKTSSVSSRCEPVSRYICLITNSVLEKVNEECNWADKLIVVPTPKESITTHVEGFLSVYTYPFTLSPLDPVIIDSSKRYEDKNKKIRKDLSSSSHEKKKTRKRLAHKPKENTSTRELTSDSLHRLRDESEEEEEEEEEEEDSNLVACVRSGSELPQTREADEETMAEASELGRVEAVLTRTEEVDKETMAEFKRQEVKTRELTEKKDAYKLLSEKSQAELEAAQKENADLVEKVRRVFKVSDNESDIMANDSNPQVQKKLDQIEQLQGEVDTVRVDVEEWKKNMDCQASEKETARAQLNSAEVQLRTVKEKNLVQAKNTEGLQSQLNSVVSGQENLVKELEATKLEVVVVRAKADDKVDQHKANAEAIQDQTKYIVKDAKWQSRREALEGVHAQNFDLLAKIKTTKIYEAKSRKLAYLEEDFEGSKESV
nr:DNA ligase 1-like [Nicotiana tomentosiformis]